MLAKKINQKNSIHILGFIPSAFVYFCLKHLIFNLSKNIKLISTKKKKLWQGEHFTLTNKIVINSKQYFN